MSPRPLTAGETRALEREFLTQDLGRHVTEDGRVDRRKINTDGPVTRIGRQLTRTLYGLRRDRSSALAAEAAVLAIVTAMDETVVAWSRKNSAVSPLTVDGIRSMARIIADAAERVGLTMPSGPSLDQQTGWPYPPASAADTDLGAIEPDDEDPDLDDDLPTLNPDLFDGGPR